MRILTFLHSFEPGGVERVAIRLVARWRTAGVDAPLFMGRSDGPLRREVAAGLEFTAPAPPPFGSAWWETLWMIAKLPGHIRQTAPDVLFCAGNTYTVVAVALKLILGRDCPPVVVKISNDLVRADLWPPARAAWRCWLRIQARFIDRWIVMDAAILADVAALIGPVACAVVPDPAIDRLPNPRISRLPGCGTRYVSVGRLVSQKDHASMLAAFATGASAQDRLTIIGDGPLRKRLERQAVKLGIATRVEWRGHVPNAIDAMRDHDVLLLSSRYEGVPAVLVEALASGLRIVATDCGPGVRALLGNGAFGRLVAPGDRAALAGAIAAAPSMEVDTAAAQDRARAFTLDGAAPLYLEAFAGAASCADQPTIRVMSQLA